MSSFLDLTKEQRLWVIRNDNHHSTSDTTEITCPWCDTKQNFDYDYVTYEDDSHSEHKCFYCEKEFMVRCNVERTWETELPQEYLIKQAQKIVPKETQDD